MRSLFLIGCEQFVGIASQGNFRPANSNMVQHGFSEIITFLARPFDFIKQPENRYKVTATA
jgi:hypothetical protein